MWLIIDNFKIKRTKYINTYICIKARCLRGLSNQEIKVVFNKKQKKNKNFKEVIKF